MTNTLQPGPRDNLRRSLRVTAERTLAVVGSFDGPRRADGAGPGGVDGVGVTLVVDGASIFVGANTFTDAVDEVQYAVGEGPCLSAVAAGRIVISTRIGTTERRWPRFIRETSALELRSVCSAPITSGSDVIGSVNVYSRTPSGLTLIPAKVLHRVAADAEIELSGPRLVALVESGAQHLAAALDDRADIEHAVGLLMDRYLTNAGQARALLVQIARYDDTTEAAAARTLTHPGEVDQARSADSPTLDRPRAPRGEA